MDGFDIKTSVARDGGTQKVAFEATENIFNKGVATSDITVYVTGLDNYVHSNWFDSMAFMEDRYESSYVDDYDMIISSDATKLTGSDITVVRDDGKNLTIQFKAPASKYCLYQVEFNQDSVSTDGLAVVEYDIPTGSMPTLALEIIGTYYEYQDSPAIEIAITNGTFESSVPSESILFDGGFAELTILSVETTDDKMVIHTDGTIPMCNGINGIVALTADAYVGPSRSGINWRSFDTSEPRLEW